MNFYRDTIVLPLYGEKKNHQARLTNTNEQSENSRSRLPLSTSHLRLGPIQNLLELSHAIPHPRMHIRLGTLDMIMQVITEQLNMRNRPTRHRSVGKVPREQHECDVSCVVCAPQVWEVADFERGVAVGVEDLGGVLDGRLTAGVDEFLDFGFGGGHVSVMVWYGMIRYE